MLTIDTEAPGEAGAREALLDRVFGPARFTKPSERLRRGRLPVLALVARENAMLIGTVRLWAVEAESGSRLLLLGPLAIAPLYQERGVGARLMRSALNQAAAAGHSAVVLVGDLPYYGRFGFTAALTHALEMPAPVERHRFLGLELTPGALTGARGLLRPVGALAPLPALRPLPLPACPAGPRSSLRL